MLQPIEEVDVPLTERNRIRERVVRMLTKSAKGRSASEVVDVVARDARISPDEVRTQVRILLESGRIEVGKNLNLFARKTASAG